MRKFSRLLAVALVLILAPVVSAQPDHSAILDRLGEIRREVSAPGVTAAVAVDGEVVFSGGVGWAELENQTPASGATVHAVASISKVMTTVAVMQLVEQGRVRLDDFMGRHVSSLPANVSAVTLRQVLTHTSGLRGAYGLTDITRFHELAEAVTRHEGAPLLFTPGAFWSYSPHGFNLLQGLIERASGVGFEEYMRANVWEPAGMYRTSFDVPTRIVPRRGRGYERDESGELINSVAGSRRYRYAAGAMLSTAEDLVRLGVAINESSVLQPATVAAMHAPQMSPVRQYVGDGNAETRAFGQAIGWWVGTDAAGRDYRYHPGRITGVGSVLINYPNERLVVALIGNILPFDAHAHGQTVAQMFLSER